MLLIKMAFYRLSRVRFRFLSLSFPVRQGNSGGAQAPRLSLHLLAPQYAARTLAGRLAVRPHRAAVDKVVLDPRRRGRRHLEGRAVGDGLGIEDGDVGIAAGRQDAAAGKT